MNYVTLRLDLKCKKRIELRDPLNLSSWIVLGVYLESIFFLLSLPFFRTFWSYNFRAMKDVTRSFIRWSKNSRPFACKGYFQPAREDSTYPFSPRLRRKTLTIIYRFSLQLYEIFRDEIFPMSSPPYPLNIHRRHRVQEGRISLMAWQLRRPERGALNVVGHPACRLSSIPINPHIAFLFLLQATCSSYCRVKHNAIFLIAGISIWSAYTIFAFKPMR